MRSFRTIALSFFCIISCLEAPGQQNISSTEENRLLYKDSWELGTKSVSNMSANIFEYSGMPDWYGLHIAQTSEDNKSIIMGQGGDGVLLTPTVTPSSGYMTIVLEMCSLDKTVKHNNFVVYLADSDTGGQMVRENGTFMARDKNITREWEHLLMTIPADFPCRLMIMPYKVAELRSIAVYDGQYSLSDVITSTKQPRLSKSKNSSTDTSYDIIGRPFLRGVRINKEKKIITR